MSYLTSETEIREVIGTPPSTIYLKKINLLETHSKRYLSMSHLIAISAKSISNKILLVATQTSEMNIVDDKNITLKVRNCDQIVESIKNEPCGLYVLVAGFEESLRINGKLSITSLKTNVTSIEIKIDELYFHCAKSIKRSQFWKSKNYRFPMKERLKEVDFFNNELKEFIQKSSFLLLATQNKEGEADLSPRGDPDGFVRILDKNRILIPERPGNKIADSLSNLTANSSISIILFVAGSKLSLILIGSGKLTASSKVLEPSKVKNKTPKLGIETHRYEGIFWNQLGIR